MKCQPLVFWNGRNWGVLKTRYFPITLAISGETTFLSVPKRTPMGITTKEGILNSKIKYRISKHWHRKARSPRTCGKESSDVVRTSPSHGREMLGLYERVEDRITKIIPEIIKWRAYVRHSKFIESNASYVASIKGVRLNDPLMDFNHLLNAKRAEFWT